ncbi:Crp/Fnr family transcriptional regulator [Desulfobacter hydrogenophilus]|uniref:Crp/Fnr family transcriptional regulator n=1 Tax=Desulfobacter hydrogenophilus TaxID=2291 RepID=UPI0013D2FCA8|nr:Crp/Fnr family transcriptional regulator [Desulfobacter hydrogenophilus]NDY71847.1 Crp/Fnr family transcriptional regulator [Desulfobacter hydrogenophilus]
MQLKKEPDPHFFKTLLSHNYRDVLKYGINKRISPKGYLFHEGEPATRCYLVVEGCLKLSKLNVRGREVILRYISSGEMTATPIVLKGGVYPVTAQAIKETEVISWDRNGFFEIVQKCPEMSLDLITLLFERLEALQQRYMELCSEQAPLRIAKFMISLMTNTGRKKGNGVYIDIPLSRQNIADHIGASMFTVSRILSDWEKSGWLKSSRQSVTITDPKALEAFVNNN